MWPLQAGPPKRLWEQGKEGKQNSLAQCKGEDKTLASYLIPVKIPTTFPVIYRSSGIMKYQTKR